MRTRTRSRPKTQVKQDEAEALLRRALAQPGVRTVLEVYRAWQNVERDALPYSRALQGKPIVAASDSSRPLTW